LIVITLAGAGAGVCQQKAAKVPDTGYRIVFDRLSRHWRDKFLDIDVYVMDMKGKRARALTTNHLSHNPAWSPDGRDIAYLSELHQPIYPSTLFGDVDNYVQYRDYMGLSRALFIIDADGNNATQIASLGRDPRDVFWFPDGKRIGVRATDIGKRSVFVDAVNLGFLDFKNMKGETLKEYFSAKTVQPNRACVGGYGCLMEWIPPVDNFQPVYIASRSFEYSTIHYGPGLASVSASADYTRYLGAVSMDGKIEGFPPGAYDLAWSPDGKSVAYSTFDKSDYAVLDIAPVLNGRVGEIDRTLTDQALDAHGPVWSSDGTRIAFMGLWKESSQIFIIGADGKGLSQLSQNKKLSCYHPSWSPDGKWIVAGCRNNYTNVRPLAEDFQNYSKIYLFDLSNPKAKPRSLTTCASGGGNECGDSNPSFAPGLAATIR
jgi:dipeptidyl aminopeptidase/acylaminoacyl peptidase